MVRCKWHIALGAVLPWLGPASNVGLVILFCAYQYLQYKHRTALGEIDRSYLDVKETAIIYTISTVVKSIMMYLGVFL